MRLDLLDLVTSATRKDILWLLKGGRAPSYKIVAPSSTSKPAQGQGQGCHRWRSLAFRQKPVQSTCNPANSAKSAPTRPPSWCVRRAPRPRERCPRLPLPPLLLGSSPLHLPPAPPPRGTGVGGRPGPGSALGRPPSRQRPPLGCWAWWWWLEGVEPPVTGLYGLGATYWVEGTETRWKCGP